MTQAGFSERTDPFRRELLAYAYRMLGSPHDAEDAVQETYLRAWQGYSGFAERSSVRTWLYRIATNACIRAAERQGRRPLPADLDRNFLHDGVSWLEPAPDAMLLSADTERSSVRLAFVAALQHLPARQRAALILRDVLAWPAADVADLLGTTVASVTSALQRARAQIDQVRPVQDDVREPTEPEVRKWVDRYVTAFENADLHTLVGLMRQDVVWEMPPKPEWYAGRDAVGRFVGTTVLGTPGSWRITRTAANGQPALATYLRDADGRYHAHGIQVLTLTPGGIASVVTFLDPTIFDLFGLPKEA